MLSNFQIPIEKFFDLAKLAFIDEEPAFNPYAKFCN